MQLKQILPTIFICFSFFCPVFAQQATILSHGGSVQTAVFSPIDNSVIASAGDTNIIKLWDLQDNTSTTLRGHSDQVNSLAFSPDGQLLASGSDDWTFKLWDVRTERNIATLEQISDRYRSQIKAVTFSPDGQLLATGGQHVKLWDITSQSEIATLRHDTYVLGLAFAPDGKHLAAGAQGGVVKIWNVKDRKVTAEVTADTRYAKSVTFSPDGRTFASAGYDGQIKMWSVSNWELLGTLQNWGTAYTLNFSPDSKVLASTGHGKVILWSVESGEEIASLTGYPAWVLSTAFSPDGQRLVSSGDDGTVRIHNLKPYLQTLQQRETVRLIYFLPQNRAPQPDINTKLDTLIKDVQEFYAQQMNNHGYGRKTFTYETDTNGKAMVHQVNGKYTDSYYHIGTFDKIIEEIEDRFDLSKNLYFISIDIGSEKIDTHWCGKGGVHGTLGGKAVLPASGNCFVGNSGFETAAHELGHAFGLEHDFRNDAYIMSYGSDRKQLSPCAAEWLDVHRYFNSTQNDFNEPTTIAMHTPIALPSNTIRFRFEVTDADGLHQAQLVIPTAVGDPTEGTKLHSCQSLSTESEQIEFTATELTIASETEVTVKVIDVNGNFTQKTYPIRSNEIAHVDVNGDGMVNVADLVRIASGFNTTVVGNANSNLDVNNNGIINREDLLLVMEVLEVLESVGNIPEAPASTTTVGLSPLSVQSTVIGEQIMLFLKIDSGENVAGYQATVRFDTTALRFVESSNGDYLPAGAFFIQPVTENNMLTLAASSLAGETDGKGTLATLTFEVIALKPSTVLLSDMLLTNSTGSILVPQRHPSEISVTPQPTGRNTTVKLSPASMLLPAINERLTFSLKIVDGETVAGFQATVQFDTTALRYVESSNGDYLPAGAFFIPPIVSGRTVTLSGASLAGESSGDGTLATLTFEVVAEKASTVSLSDVLLTDSSGGSSTPQIENAAISKSLKLPEDVNDDGVVNIVDLTLVASNFGKTGENAADVNGDGVVNITDLTLVDAAFGNTAAAPIAWNLDFAVPPTHADVAAWLHEARQVNLTDPAFQRGILVLERLLAALLPKKTALLPNYPNPFNPETWIPYQLAAPADVTVTIYAVDGTLVRTLSLGHKPIGIYQNRTRAAYWDGKNRLGEPVASGVYFYTLTAGDFTATRKMLIRK